MGKYLVPGGIILVVLFWLGFYGFGILSIPGASGWQLLLKLGGLFIVLLIMGMAVRVLIDRIREIKEEDEDDYRQY